MQNSPTPALILASSSRYRKSLLERLKIPFECATPEVDETPHTNESASQLAGRLALAKARALRDQFAEALIIGSDQVAECEGKLLGKPGTKAAAREQLAQCSGKSVTFYTGLCLYNNRDNRFACQTLPYQVTFLSLSDEQIHQYVELEQPLDCAGSFKCEGLGSALFSAHHGTDPTALEGLPLIALCAMLRAEGLDPLARR